MVAPLAAGSQTISRIRSLAGVCLSIVWGLQSFRTHSDGHPGKDGLAAADEQLRSLRDQVQQPESSVEARKFVSWRGVWERVAD